MFVTVAEVEAVPLMAVGDPMVDLDYSLQRPYLCLNMCTENEWYDSLSRLDLSHHFGYTHLLDHHNHHHHYRSSSHPHRRSGSLLRPLQLVDDRKTASLVVDEDVVADEF